VSLEIVTRQDGDHVAVDITHASGQCVSVGLSRHQALDLILQLFQTLHALPSDPLQPLNQQVAFLRSRHPSFQVGMGNDGDVRLALKQEPLPPMEFDFDAESLSKLIADLRKAANVPSHPQGKPS
jgi:hypothetical protein